MNRSHAVLLPIALAATFAPSAAGAAEVADATVGYRVLVADELTANPDLTRTVVGDFGGVNRFGGADFRANGHAYADAEKGIGLYVLWAVSIKPATNPGALVRAEISGKKQRPVQLGAEVVAWSEDVGAKLATASLEYRDAKSGVRTLLRTLMFAGPDGRLREIDVECALREDALAGTRKLCEDAMASLGVTVPEGELVVLEAATATATGKATATDTATATNTGPPMRTQTGRQSRRWYLILGGALVVLGVSIAMLRKRKEIT